ncbi:putative DNA-binding transcriptional regulator YafY [Paenibacillus intestini]|nr:putative DNA-binding transcriptional regulator YafY [Paenibacillus intestini]
MHKAQRLVQLIMLVNERRTFTVQELADECGVSRRTMIRDLAELSGLGIPLYSEVGPHGGYRVLREKVLPPISFSEHEAMALFFAAQSLQNYKSLPFNNEVQSALRKFFHYLSSDLKLSYTPWVVGFFLGLGTDAHVTHPPQVRDQIRSKLQAMAAQYGD